MKTGPVGDEVRISDGYTVQLSRWLGREGGRRVSGGSEAVAGLHGVGQERDNDTEEGDEQM
jgi:hypothetical protein